MFSVVRFGMSVRNPDVHAVTSDQLRAVVMAMEKIRQRGYGRIGLVVPRDFDRHLGGNYVGGFAAHELCFDLGHLLPPLPTDIAAYTQQPARARAAIERWLHKCRRMVVLTTVPQVPGKMLAEIGVRIPGDLPWPERAPSMCRWTRHQPKFRDDRAYRGRNPHFANQPERARSTGGALPDSGGEFLAGRQIPAATGVTVTSNAGEFLDGFIDDADDHNGKELIPLTDRWRRRPRYR